MKLFLYLSLFFFAFYSCKSTENKTNNALTNLEKSLDSLVQPFIDSTKAAGVAVAAFKGKEKIILKSYGYADLEFKIKLPVDASFEIGSVTKQFTAAAILQLVDSGKINLDEEITKYIKFNTQGHKVTVRQLLSHTSGIKGYTELPLFGQISKQKYSRDTLLRLVEKEKFDFNPGEALIYNNTGFFMLGLIIEKVTGMPYENYIQKNLFDNAGMTHSYYCSESKITLKRAHGYDTGEKGLVRADYLDHTWPFAAGSLCSTVEDLVHWDQALHHGLILNEKMYKEFLTPTILNDGSVTHYAKGITVTEDHGVTMIEHGGGINGFLSENRYYPKEDISIVVLVNSTGPVSPQVIANNIANSLLTPSAKSKAINHSDLTRFKGTYSGRGRGQDMTIMITSKDSTLVLQRNERPDLPLTYSKDDTWSDGNTQYIFKGDKDMINELRLDQTYGYLILKKVK